MNSTMSAAARLGCCILSILTCYRGASAAEPHHYVFFNRDRQRISDAAFLGTKTFEGAQLKYTWRELPQYLVNDPRYNGGADKQYSIREDDEEHALPEG